MIKKLWKKFKRSRFRYQLSDFTKRKRGSHIRLSMVYHDRLDKWLLWNNVFRNCCDDDGNLVSIGAINRLPVENNAKIKYESVKRYKKNAQHDPVIDELYRNTNISHVTDSSIYSSSDYGSSSSSSYSSSDSGSSSSSSCD